MLLAVDAIPAPFAVNNENRKVGGWKGEREKETAKSLEGATLTTSPDFYDIG